MTLVDLIVFGIAMFLCGIVVGHKMPRICWKCEDRMNRTFNSYQEELFYELGLHKKKEK